MIVISDTSPLNYLILIEAVEVLPARFARTVVPPAVIRELSHEAAPDQVRAWAAAAPAWLEVVSPTQQLAAARLGAGESEAIQLALELGADALLMDDRQGRSAAMRFGLRCVSLANTLDLAAQQRLIDLPLIVKRLGQTTFRCPRAILEELLERHRRR